MHDVVIGLLINKVEFGQNKYLPLIADFTPPKSNKSPTSCVKRLPYR